MGREGDLVMQVSALWLALGQCGFPVDWDALQANYGTKHIYTATRDAWI